MNPFAALPVQTVDSNHNGDPQQAGQKRHGGDALGMEMDAVIMAKQGPDRGEEGTHHDGNALFFNDRDTADVNAFIYFIVNLGALAPVVQRDMVIPCGHPDSQRFDGNLDSPRPRGNLLVPNHCNFQVFSTPLSVAVRFQVHKNLPSIRSRRRLETNDIIIIHRIAYKLL